MCMNSVLALPAFTILPHCPHCYFLHSSLHHSHTHHISKALCKPGCVSCMNTSGWCNGFCSDILPFLEWPVVQVESSLWWVGSCHWNSDNSHVGVGQKDFASFQLLGTTPYFGPEHVQYGAPTVGGNLLLSAKCLQNRYHLRSGMLAHKVLQCILRLLWQVTFLREFH